MNLRNAKFLLSECGKASMATGDALECFLNSDNRKQLVVFHPPWNVSWKYALKLRWRAFQLARKSIRVVIGCNQREEVTRLRLLGVRAYLLNQNMHLPERVYRPMPVEEKKYDAYYAAQALPFKRIWLAEKIEKLFVLTYGKRAHTKSGGYDLHAYEPRVKHADFNRGFIEDKDEICSLMSQSVCGLALSEKEGAMWASMEYLMCGLPVVTTKNIGGRDHYLNDVNATWVAADAESVADAVNHYCKHPKDPGEIRSAVLEKVQRDRDRFIDIISLEASRIGIEKLDSSFIWGGERGVLEHEMPICS